MADKAYTFVSTRHDDGELTLLGRQGKLTGDDLLQTLIEHPATARRLAWRICTMFFGEGAVPDSALVTLATELHARKLDIRWAVETILRSHQFSSPQNLRSRILGPVEFIVGCLQALEQCQPPPSTLLLAEWTTRMGQDLFYPPNVGGWPEGRSWLSSRAVIARANFASSLVEGSLWNSNHKPDLRRLVEHNRHAAGVEQSVEWFAELIYGQSVPSAIGAALAAAHGKDEKEKLPAALVALLSSPEAQLA